MNNFKLLSRIKTISRLFYGSSNLRTFALKRKLIPELPTSSNERQKISGFGKFLLLIPITTFSLGCWQVKRKIWKENLIKELESKLHLDAISLPDDLDDFEKMEYKTVSVRGNFIHDREMYLGPRSLINTNENDAKNSGGIFSTRNASSGYYVVTPFKLENREETILVNRGWVSRQNLNPNSRKDGQINGVVEIQGIIRLSENRPQFSPEHKSGPFLYRDIPKMCAISGADPYYIDVKFDPKIPFPIGGQTKMTSIRNEHLSYIITWYSLSAFTFYLWFRIVVKKMPF